MARILLINPNTNAATTETMLSIARDAAPNGNEIKGITARFGADLIETEETLETATHAVAEILNGPAAGYDGVVIAAFGDPGLDRAPLGLNVVGIAEAGMRLAADEDRRFSIVTTTPGLAKAIERLVLRYGLEEQFASLRFTEGAPIALMSDPESLDYALRKAASAARDIDGAEAVVIGGGPLARAAARLADELLLPIIEPIPAAVRLVMQQLSAQQR